ncbi:MAG: DUF6544 family protein [Sulfurimonas sp.]
MGIWLLSISGIITIAFIIVIFIGLSREKAKRNEQVAMLIQSASQPSGSIVDFNSLSALPAPVARYFRHVLTDGQKLIKTARMHQSGLLRAGVTKERWSAFTAQQLAVPPATGFIWNAKVEMPFSTHVRVLDSYSRGIGSGRVSLFSAFSVASEAGSCELNSGALHRYLAESVWFPTALLPESGVTWSPINDYSALATITDNGTTVSLEFQFGDAGEVIGIYTPNRYGIFGGAYQQVPWEGHFRNYQVRAGMRVPLYGEVGWYVEGRLQLVWKGDLTDVQYEFEA